MWTGSVSLQERGSWGKGDQLLAQESSELGITLAKTLDRIVMLAKRGDTGEPMGNRRESANLKKNQRRGGRYPWGSLKTGSGASKGKSYAKEKGEDLVNKAVKTFLFVLGS